MKAHHRILLLPVVFLFCVGCAQKSSYYTRNPDFDEVWLGTLDAVSDHLHVRNADTESGVIIAGSDTRWVRTEARVELVKKKANYSVVAKARDVKLRVLLKPSGLRTGEETEVLGRNKALEKALIKSIKRHVPKKSVFWKPSPKKPVAKKREPKKPIAKKGKPKKPVAKKGKPKKPMANKGELKKSTPKKAKPNRFLFWELSSEKPAAKKGKPEKSAPEKEKLKKSVAKKGKPKKPVAKKGEPKREKSDPVGDVVDGIGNLFAPSKPPSGFVMRVIKDVPYERVFDETEIAVSGHFDVLASDRKSGVITTRYSSEKSIDGIIKMRAIAFLRKGKGSKVTAVYLKIVRERFWEKWEFDHNLSTQIDMVGYDRRLTHLILDEVAARTAR